MKKNRQLLFIMLIIFAYSVNAQELYTQVNAANSNNEGNSTLGWSGNAGLTSVTDEVYQGNHSIRLEALSDGWRLGTYDFVTVPGDQYKITIHAKGGNPVRQGFYNWEGFSDFTARDNIAQVWTKYTWELTANSTTAQIKIFLGHPSVTGNTVYLDDISIVKLDIQEPTAPGLSSSPAGSTNVVLSWTGATDNIGIAGYKVYKDGSLETTLGNVNTYEVIGLTANTSYEFTVKALDAYGNESVNSNPLYVTTSTNSGGSSGETVWTQSGANINYVDGNVGIGTTNPDAPLTVKGQIHTQEVLVDLDGAVAPDYVFLENYKLRNLAELEESIQEYGHLPNIPSAKEMEENGIELKAMSLKLLEKIEELTLYVIELKKEIEILKKN